MELPDARARERPKRVWRRRWFWLTGVGAMMLSVVALWFWIVPRVVESSLRSWLEQQGAGELAIESVEIGLRHMVAAGVRIDSAAPGTGHPAGHLRIAEVAVEFTWADLWARRVDTLVLDAPIWTMAEGKPASPSEEDLQRLAEVAPRVPTRSLPAVPVRQVILRRGRIELPPGSDTEAVLLDGSLQIADGRWDLDFVASAGPQRVQATVNLQELPVAEPPQAGGALELVVAGSQPLEFEGSCELRATAEGRVLTLDLRRQPGAFEVAVAEVTCTGEGAVEVLVSLPFAQLDAADVVVRVQELDLSSATGIQIRGLTSRMHLYGMPLPTSFGPQHVTWRSARVADVAVGSGNATFELLPGPEFVLQLRQRTLDDIGSVKVEGLRIARDWSTSPTTLVLDQVPLQGVLELLSRGRITGEGRLSGSLTLLLQTEPRFAIDLGDGRLAAAPGGVVRFLDDADTEELVRQHAQSIAGSPGQDAVVQQRLVDALEEFGFTALDFHIDAEGEGVTLRVHAAGAGRKVAQPLDLDVNVHGFHTMVNNAVALKLGMDRAKQNLSDDIDTRSPKIRTQRKP